MASLWNETQKHGLSRDNHVMYNLQCRMGFHDSGENAYKTKLFITVHVVIFLKKLFGKD